MRIEIAAGGGRKGSEVQLDKYANIRDRFPGGLPGAVASTIHTASEVPAPNNQLEENDGNGKQNR